MRKPTLTMSDFYAFRKRFNQWFSLSFDGKFKSLGYLLETYGIYFVEHFIVKFNRIVEHRLKTSRPLGDIITFKLSSHIVKLYYR